MNNPSAELLLQFSAVAREAADLAREVTRKWFRSGIGFDSKDDRSPVTIADHEAEQAMRDHILAKLPDHGFFGEESGHFNSGADWQWVVDPIDGTKCFATGNPTFGTLVSALYCGEPVIGLIDHVMLDDRWIGIQGLPTTHNGEPCRSRSTAAVGDATLYTTTADMFDGISGPRAERLAKQCRFRVFGGDCLGYGLVASGLNDLVCEADLKPYDFFALIPVLSGAGAVTSDWHGRPLGFDSDGEVLASANQQLHQAALELLDA